MKPLLVLHMILSNSMNIDGSMNITTSILTIAPRAIRSQSELMISISEYNPSALTIIDGIDVECAIFTASCLLLPSQRSRLYRVVISIA